ncbi:unnamed protein product [Calypogeia fissa]
MAMATAAAVGSQLASVAALSSAEQISASGISMRGLSRSTGLGMPTIECAKHPQKKATAHHNKTRPKKHNPYDKNRHGPTLYPAVAKAPPIWGLDTGDDAVPDVWGPDPKPGRMGPIVAPSS